MRNAESKRCRKRDPTPLVRSHKRFQQLLRTTHQRRVPGSPVWLCVQDWRRCAAAHLNVHSNILSWACKEAVNVAAVLVSGFRKVAFYSTFSKTVSGALCERILALLPLRGGSSIVDIRSSKSSVGCADARRAIAPFVGVNTPRTSSHAYSERLALVHALEAVRWRGLAHGAGKASACDVRTVSPNADGGRQLIYGRASMAHAPCPRSGASWGRPGRRDATRCLQRC